MVGTCPVDIGDGDLVVSRGQVLLREERHVVVRLTRRCERGVVRADHGTVDGVRRLRLAIGV